MPVQAVFSNQLDALFDALCARLQAAPRDPFSQDTVIVPSSAVQRWLQQRLAQQRGIAANLDLRYLAPWLHGLLRDAGDPEPLGSAWVWRVYELLGHPKLLREHPRLSASLGEPEAPAREALRWERAQAAAALLERLGLERPDWLAAWRERRGVTGEPDEPWLAALWRAVGDDAGDLLARRLDRLAAPPPEGLRAAALARPVHLFALPRIAPLHWQALQRLGAHAELQLYQLNPCREYWFDLVSPRRLARLQAQGRDDAHEVGHPLLALNAQGLQQQLQQLADAGLHADDGDYREPSGDHLLARLQRSLLDLQPLAAAAPNPEDRSLSLHVCHSLTRELEVLHDRLLGLIAANPSLQLGDILVLCPDIDAAAPRIEAVFGSAPPPRFLPYAITGQTAPPLPAPLQRFLSRLALLDGPAPATLLAELLPADAGDAGDTLDALQAAGLRAGLDAAHAQQHGLSPAHTLDAALQRLLLAHCLPAQTLPPLGPWQAAPRTLPRAALAALQAFATGLRQAARATATPQVPARWTALLQQWAADWLSDGSQPSEPDADDDAGRALRDAIARLAEAWQRAGLTEALPLGRVRAALLEALHDPIRGGVPTGAVTFSSLASLRSLPARVVALIGLDDGAWPRAAAPQPFDLLAAHPRAGDRQPRQEQRQLLLEALLAARDVLHLSHSGRSLQDDSPRPPSVLLAELADFVGPALPRCEHPLQPFSPRAFDPATPPLQSFRAELLPPAQPGPAAPFLPGPLPRSGADAEPLSLRQLQAALRHLGRDWLQRRLGLKLPWDEAPWEPAEPFALDRLALSDWAERWAPRLTADTPDAEVLAWAATDPRWPPGALAEPALRAELPRLRAYAAAQAAWRAAPRLALPAPLALADGSALRFDGSELRELDGRPRLRIAKFHAQPGAADQLATWAAHLALQAALGPEAGAQLLHAEGLLQFQPVAEPLPLLQHLVALVQADTPPFLPVRTALAWVDDGPAKAASAWRNERFGGESQDAHWALLRRADPPNDDDALDRLAPLAEAVMGPMGEHRA